ncbi:MAG: peptide deformylase [Fermentimonas sp.]|nr:peptide deformylase [Fermentimonas sp.]
MRTITTIFIIIISIQLSMAFTERELEIIRNGDTDTTFRVLLITDAIDSFTLRMQSSDINQDSITNDEDLQLLIKRLILTMNEAGGVGIAAPQVGVLKNIFLFVRFDNPEYPVQVAINPRIVNHPNETICFEGDGCLSIPNISTNSIRFPWVEVEYWDENGNFHKEKLMGYSREDDFTSIIFQHEFDHLNGILFTDKICTPSEDSEIED